MYITSTMFLIPLLALSVFGFISCELDRRQRGYWGFWEYHKTCSATYIVPTVTALLLSELYKGLPLITLTVTFQ